MIPHNSLLSERLATLGALNPVSITAGATLTSSYVNLIGTTNGKFFGRLIAYAQAGLGTSNGTNAVSFAVVKASDVTGTGATAIATTSYTSTNGVIIEFDINGALVDTSKPCVAIQASFAGTTGSSVVISGLIVGSDGRYDPALSYNLTSTTSITTVSTIGSV